MWSNLPNPIPRSTRYGGYMYLRLLESQQIASRVSRSRLLPTETSLINIFFIFLLHSNFFWPHLNCWLKQFADLVRFVRPDIDFHRYWHTIYFIYNFVCTFFYRRTYQRPLQYFLCPPIGKWLKKRIAKKFALFTNTISVFYIQLHIHCE